MQRPCSVRKSTPGVVYAALALAALAGCQTLVDVRRVATDGAPAYDLRGGDLVALQQRAQGLCPHGYQTVRQWEHQQQTEGDDNVLHRSWLQTEQTLGLLAAGEAQMTVQCLEDGSRLRNATSAPRGDQAGLGAARGPA